MPYTIVRNDITNMVVDAIVNSAGTRYSRIGGVEKTILDLGGSELEREKLALGDLEVSEAKHTKAPNLLSKYVIHVVGPIYSQSLHPEFELRKAYQNALSLALQLGVESIAFPLISSGSYGYPKKKALVIAQQEILSFLEEADMMIYLVVYDRDSFTISKDFQRDIEQFIVTGQGDKRYRKVRTFYAENRRVQRATEQSYGEEIDLINYDMPDVEEGFTKALLDLIDKTGQKDSYIYKKANIDRKLFSKIRNNPYYRPSKNTILAFAFALKLSLNETNELLAKAGYTLSQSIRFDVIIATCLRKHKHDIYEVNEILFYYDQELLGSQ